MKAYVGQARGSKLVAKLTALGFGEMTVREEFPPRRFPWVFDNGAFKDWGGPKKNGKFQTARYEEALERMVLSTVPRPDFVVVPDIVAAGLESLRFSDSWLPRLTWLALPLYLVVQDGMTEGDVAVAISAYAGLFVGGSPEWKMLTAPQWVQFAHLHGKPCHIGRMGTRQKVRAARRWGADSIDSCTPLWSEANLARFVAGFSDPLDDLLGGDEGSIGVARPVSNIRSVFQAPKRAPRSTHSTGDLFS